MGIYGTTAGVQGPDQACSEGGAGTTVPPKPPLEPEACSNLSNSKLTYIYSDFLLFLSIDNVTMHKSNNQYSVESRKSGSQKYTHYRLHYLIS